MRACELHIVSVINTAATPFLFLFLFLSDLFLCRPHLILPFNANLELAQIMPSESYNPPNELATAVDVIYRTEMGKEKQGEGQREEAWNHSAPKWCVESTSAHI